MPRQAQTKELTIVHIKKYPNRRLYNTDTSVYITLDELYDLVRQDVEFVVSDAKSGEDITRQILAQIIFERESRGVNLLPISFLRSLIRFYGEDMQKVLPSYLEVMMENFTANQKQFSEMMGKGFNPQAGFGAYSQLEAFGKQNMALFEQAMAMFNPLAKK